MIEINFVKEKETKNTVKFEEKPETGKPAIIGTLYIQKWFIGSADTVKIMLDEG